MQRVAIEILCDICWKDDHEETVAENSQVLGVGSKIIQLDWCAAHDAAQYALTSLVDLFLVYGTRMDSKAKQAIESRSDLYCEICERPFKRQSNYNNHMAAHRGENMVQCPECEREFSGNQPLALHRSRTHGVVGANQSLRLVRQASGASA